MLSSGLVGVLCMASSGIGMNALLTVQKIIIQKGWSDITLLTLTCLLGVGGQVLWLPFSTAKFPLKSDLKWIGFVGFFSAGSTMLMIFSVQVGMPLGDFAALNSTNVVFAAFLGRLFLGEPLRWPHGSAVLFSIGGALLISRPRAIFGSEGGAEGGSADVVWVGYILALMSGFCDACIYVSSRKAGHVSQLFIIMSILLQFGLANFVSCLAFDAWDFRPWTDNSAEAVGWFAALFASGAFTAVLFTAAAQMCPAAVSATVDTATRMVSGYCLQALLFGAAINTLTICGSLLMFSGVVLVAVFGSPAAESPAPSDPEGPPSDYGPLTTASLASFAASEFTGVPVLALADMELRQRRPTLAPEVVGRASAATPTS